MELLLVKLVGLARPLASMQFGERFFSLLGIGLFSLLVGAVLVRAAVGKSLRLSAIDAVIFAFMAWCITRAVAYQDTSYIDGLAKLLIPLFSYIIVKNVVPDQGEYRRVILWIIAGFSIPTLFSAAMIATGSPGAIHAEMWQTGLLRWEGAYNGAHGMGHSMTLFLMTLVLYVNLRGMNEVERQEVSTRVENMLLGLIGAMALYCLYMSAVRSALLGLLIFAGLYGYLQNKKALVLGGAALAVVAVVTAPAWIPALLHEFAPDRRTGPIELAHVGSGRVVRWANDVFVYASLPIDQKLAGVGVGVRETVDGDWLGGHNDWLRILLDTGIIGFALFASLQILILRAILRLHGRERHLFLAVFAAVNVMMLVSNSYNLRIQVSQLYYMILAFIEIPRQRIETGDAGMRSSAISKNDIQNIERVH